MSFKIIRNLGTGYTTVLVKCLPCKKKKKKSVFSHQHPEKNVNMVIHTGNELDSETDRQTLEGSLA